MLDMWLVRLLLQGLLSAVLSTISSRVAVLFCVRRKQSLDRKLHRRAQLQGFFGLCDLGCCLCFSGDGCVRLVPVFRGQERRFRFDVWRFGRKNSIQRSGDRHNSSCNSRVAVPRPGVVVGGRCSVPPVLGELPRLAGVRGRNHQRVPPRPAHGPTTSLLPLDCATKMRASLRSRGALILVAYCRRTRLNEEQMTIFVHIKTSTHSYLSLSHGLITFLE